MPVTAGTARTGAKGHFLQPEWDGTDSIQERYDAVRPLLLGGSILDVGCASRYGRDDWLHGLLANDATDLVGIDLNAKTIAELQAAGHDVHLADAQDFDLGRQFDVIFAGEIIEHLDNVHGFLSSVRRHLAPGGRFVLTTPNAFYVGNFIYRLGGNARVHPQHTAWYCESTLRRVLKVNGFPDAQLQFIGHTARTPARRMASASFRHLLPDRLALDTIVAVVYDPDNPGGTRDAGPNSSR